MKTTTRQCSGVIVRRTITSNSTCGGSHSRMSSCMSRIRGPGSRTCSCYWLMKTRSTCCARSPRTPSQGPITRAGRARLPQQRGSTACATRLPSTSLQDADELFHWTRLGSPPQDDDQGLGRGAGRSYWAGASCARRGGSWLCSSKAYCWHS